MPLDITTAVTGVVIGGFTAPTYTLTQAVSPYINGRKSVVSAIGGTQTGVRTHAPSDPFTILATTPIQPAPYPKLSSNGTLGKVGRNKYTAAFQKGVIPLVGQSPQLADMRIESNIPSGAEVNDAANIAAMYSLSAAWCTREAANWLALAKLGS